VFNPSAITLWPALHVYGLQRQETSSSIVHLFKTLKTTSPEALLQAPQHLRNSRFQHIKSFSPLRAPCRWRWLGIYRPRNSCVSSSLRFGLCLLVTLYLADSSIFHRILCRQTVFRDWGLSFGTSTAIFESSKSNDVSQASLVLLTDVPWPMRLHGALSHGAYVPLINVLICDSCQHW
jgi:hypothetical protein